MNESAMLAEYVSLDATVKALEERADVIKYREAVELRDAKLDSIKSQVKARGNTPPTSGYLQLGQSGKQFSAAHDISTNMRITVTYKKGADSFDVDSLPLLTFPKALVADVKVDAVKYLADTETAKKRTEIMKAFRPGPWLTPSVSVGVKS